MGLYLSKGEGFWGMQQNDHLHKELWFVGIVTRIKKPTAEGFRRLGKMEFNRARPFPA